MAPRRDGDNYTETKLNGSIKAWSQDESHWRIVKDHSVYASLNFETQRTRRRDLSGRKKYRMVTEHNVTVMVRSSYRKEYTMTEPLRFYGGEIATVHKLLEMFESGHLFDLARLEIADKARKAGATTLQLIEADDIYDWRWDERTNWENRQLALDQHIKLLEQLMN